MNLTILLATMLFLTSCGGGSSAPGESPHGEIPTTPVCRIGSTWDADSEICVEDQTIPPFVPEPQTIVETSLQPLTSEYSERSNNELDGTVLTSITLSEDFSDSVIGSCYIFDIGTSNETREIKLNKTYWDERTEDERRSLLFHELGHCVEDLGHTDGALNGDCTVQYDDDTVKVMDACTEPYYEYYIVADQDYWLFPYTGIGKHGYDFIYHRNWWHRVFYHQGFYYERVNKYNIEDMFDEFFDK